MYVKDFFKNVAFMIHQLVNKTFKTVGLGVHTTY